MYDIVLKNGYIYYQNHIAKYDIGIKNNKILKICKNISDNNNQTIFLDITNKVIMPGYINLHIHFGEYYVRGYKEKLTTEKYIMYTERFNNNNRNLKEEIRKTSTVFSAYEALETGSTTLMGIRGWNAIEDFNLRLFMGYPLMNSEKLKEYLKNPFAQFNKLKNDSLNTHYIFLHSLQTVNENILIELSKYLEKNKIKLAIHLSETIQENKYALKTYSLSPTKVLEKFNLLNENTLLVHSCYLSNEDIEIIKKYNCTICICPNSNLKLGNKLPSLKKFIKNNINVCIGSDGSATNDSLSILDSARTIGLLTNINIHDIYKMITINPAKYLKLNIGEIKEGFLADLIIFDLNHYKFVRKEVFLNNLLYSTNIKPQYVIIDGKIIINNYENVVFNEQKLLDTNLSKKLNY